MSRTSLLLGLTLGVPARFFRRLGGRGDGLGVGVGLGIGIVDALARGREVFVECANGRLVRRLFLLEGSRAEVEAKEGLSESVVGAHEWSVTARAPAHPQRPVNALLLEPERASQAPCGESSAVQIVPQLCALSHVSIGRLRPEREALHGERAKSRVPSQLIVVRRAPVQVRHAAPRPDVVHLRATRIVRDVARNGRRREPSAGAFAARRAARRFSLRRRHLPSGLLRGRDGRHRPRRRRLVRRRKDVLLPWIRRAKVPRNHGDGATRPNRDARATRPSLCRSVMARAVDVAARCRANHFFPFIA